ncbi:MAG: hypothetical protein CEO22_415 [Candidatus Berkelbacteria bacterium Gr01-1014_85]|uniref:Regulatory protein RecX n=1 Tax=Candidatus Berkelbacteria bacterium Gr01-1014_85 TaxID=2017150 RepID=A0A554JBI1_9BACT|nr:MAG: hypothetical protein CEO22_415 [Candidatus Berkelbacteria bacterium Gr01-1014_85]
MVQPRNKSQAPRDYESGWRLLLWYLGRYNPTTHRLEQYLIRKGCQPDEARQLVDKAVGLGLLDDQRFACNMIQSQLSHYGQRRISNKLISLGLTREVVQQAWESIDQQLIDPQVNLTRLLEKFLVRHHLSSSRELESKLRAKLYRQLIQAGYSYDQIKTLLAHDSSNQA